MTDSPKVTVVIPNWNGMEHLPACLESLTVQSYRDFATVVVDNGSHDGSVEFIAASHPDVEVIRLDRNRGFGAAMNIAIRELASDYTACLNNDTIADRSWLEELVACLEHHPHAAAVSSKMLDMTDEHLIDDCGDILTFYFKAYPRGHGEADEGQYDEESEVFGASGGASLWRSEVIRRLGYFDEDLFAYYEDVDLSFRARLAGYECWYAPRALVHHRGGGTSRSRANEFAYYHSVRNRWSMIIKNVPTSLLYRNAHRLAAAEVFSFARSVAERNARLTLSAYADVLRMFPAWRSKRRRIRALRTASPSELRSALSPGYPTFRRRVKDVASTFAKSGSKRG
jgi:GT2 family glycosyltransferase